MNSRKKQIKKTSKFMNDLEKLIGFESDDEKLEYEKSIIQTEFMDIIDDLMYDCDKSKKELAGDLKTSSSYVTQLFNDNKKINLTLLAKFQRVFKTNFKIVVAKEAKLKKLKPAAEYTFKHTATNSSDSTILAMEY